MTDHDQSLTMRLARLVEDLWPEILSGLAALVIALAPIIEGNWAPVGDVEVSKTLVMVLGGVAVEILALVAIVNRRSTVAELRRQVRRRNEDLIEAERSEREAKNALEDASSAILVSVFRRLGLSGHERISIYIHDGESAFFQISRYSPTYAYAQFGREQYPDGEGYLGMAWVDGETYAQDLPDPDQDRQAYTEHHEGMGMSRAAVEDLSMPARCYFARILTDTARQRNIGVIVLESCSSRGLAGERHRLSDEDIELLGHVVEMNQRYVNPEVNEAERIGF